MYVLFMAFDFHISVKHTCLCMQYCPNHIKQYLTENHQPEKGHSLGAQSGLWGPILQEAGQ